MKNNLENYYKEWMKKGYSPKQIKGYLKEKGYKNGDLAYKKIEKGKNIKILFISLSLLILILVVFSFLNKPKEVKEDKAGFRIIKEQKTPLEIINEAYRNKDSSLCNEINQKDFMHLCLAIVEKDITYCNHIINPNLIALCKKKIESA